MSLLLLLLLLLLRGGEEEEEAFEAAAAAAAATTTPPPPPPPPAAALLTLAPSHLLATGSRHRAVSGDRGRFRTQPATNRVGTASNCERRRRRKKVFIFFSVDFVRVLARGFKISFRV